MTFFFKTPLKSMAMIKSIPEGHFSQKKIVKKFERWLFLKPSEKHGNDEISLPMTIFDKNKYNNSIKKKNWISDLLKFFQLWVSFSNSKKNRVLRLKFIAHRFEIISQLLWIRRSQISKKKKSEIQCSLGINLVHPNFSDFTFKKLPFDQSFSR